MNILANESIGRQIDAQMEILTDSQTNGEIDRHGYIEDENSLFI